MKTLILNFLIKILGHWIVKEYTLANSINYANYNNNKRLIYD